MYCPACEREREIFLIRKDETYPVKGEPITVRATVCLCAYCGEEVMSPEYDNMMATISAKPMRNIAASTGFCSRKKSKLSASNTAFRKLHSLVSLE